MGTQKNSVLELTEKLAESQRELQRCKSSLQDGENMVDVLRRDLKEAEALSLNLREQLSHAECKAKEVEARNREDIIKLESEKDGQVEVFRTQTCSLEEKCTELNRELDLLRTEKTAGDTALKGLDDYKKKAQTALKKVFICNIIT